MSALSTLLFLLLACTARDGDTGSGDGGGHGGTDGGTDSGTGGGTDGGTDTATDTATDTGTDTGTDGGGGDGGSPVDSRPNILLLVSDDLGVDASACYSSPVSTRAPQPNLEALCARGLVFESAWAQPICSPTRASMLTGRYPYQHGVGEPIGGRSPGLSLDERILPAVLDAAGAGYAHAAFGKWHLADDKNGGILHPNLAGFGHFVGTEGGEVGSYTSWQRVTDGVVEDMTTYVTTQTVDDALAWMGEQKTPWFALVGFHAPHTPIHLPPAELHTYKLSGTATDIRDNDDAYFQAMVQALDTEMGRLLDSLPEKDRDRTMVIYLGDNGTLGRVNSGAWPAGHAKMSLWLGATWVPFVVAGPLVAEPGRRVGGLVDVVDIFPTVLEIAGLEPEEWADPERPVEGISLLPAIQDSTRLPDRRFHLAEWLALGGTSTSGRTISDGTYKLMRYASGEEALYDLRVDPLEEAALDMGALDAEASAALAAMQAELDARPLD